MPLRKRRTAPCYIFEGTWWRAHELPQVLPFLQILEGIDYGLSLSHKTFRSADDLRYWFKRIPKNDRAFVYLACHAEGGDLQPVDRRSRVTRDELLDALRSAKDGAIEFLHIGACESVTDGDRRRSLSALADASGARWVSGYVSEVDWLPSMLLDLAIVGKLYLPFYHDGRARRPQLQRRAADFIRTYEQFSRGLGFSGLARSGGAADKLVPGRLRG